ncbi:MAG: hypothetical protein ACOX0X_00810 [Candidatus Dojkabacteria bacterium]
MNVLTTEFSKNKIIIKKSSKIAFIISVLLCLITVIDKISLYGAINFYIHTPVIYTLIFFLHLAVVKDEWKNIQILFKELQKKITKEDTIKIFLILFPFLLVVLLKNKLNEIIINQNILSLEYDYLLIIIKIKFFAKTFVLFVGSILTALFANYLNYSITTNKQKEKSKKKTLILFILLIALFLFVKAFFIFNYDGNYQDDWYHIVAGQNFFQDGTFTKVNQYFGEDGYQRGAYMTILTNFFMFLFGRSVDIAQLAPAFIGLINFILLLTIAREVFKNNISIILFSFLYIFNPYVIFNHLFIRMYVFYELFFLLIIFLSTSLYRSLLAKKNTKIVLVFSALLLLNFFIWKYTEDRSTILFPVYSTIGIFLAFYKAINLKNFFSKISQYINKNKKVMIPILLLLFVSILLLLTELSLFTELLWLITQGTNDGSNRASLIKLICYRFAPLMMYVFLSFVTIKKHSVSKQIFIIFAFVSLVLHIALPESYQVIRGFNYTWGVLLIATVIMIEELIKQAVTLKKSLLLLPLIFTFLLSSLLIPTIKSYHKTFLSTGPSILGEVAYYEFDKTFSYLQKEHSKDTIISITYNVVPDMYYGLPSKYVFNANGKISNYYFPEEITILNTLDEVESLARKENVCFLLRDYTFGVLAGFDVGTYIINNYSIEKIYEGYSIWCERTLENKLPKSLY